MEQVDKIIKSEELKEDHAFGIKDKVGYMLGNVGNDFTFQLASTYLMIFLTNIYGISPAFVGTLFLVARMLDAFTDVGMGVIVDQSQPTKSTYEGRQIYAVGEANGDTCYGREFIHV